MPAGRFLCHGLALIIGIVYLSQSVSCKLAPLHKQSEKDRVPGHYIVVLKDDVDVDTFTTAFQTSVRSGASEGTIRRTYRHAIKGFSAQLPEQSLNELRDSKHVKFVEEVSIVRASTISSWGLGRVDQRNLPLDSDTPSYPGYGSGTHIYVIDTGTSKTHNEFGGRVSDQGFDVIDSPPQIGLDCEGHGTHCAGTAAGGTYGVASEATIHSVRVLGCDGSGTSEGVIAGMDWVADNAIQPAVASMSLGGPMSQADNDAVANLFEAGVVVSVAAGNEDQDACDVSPASAPKAITVGATDDSDTRADFSNYGSCVDIFAPGVGITSSVIGDGDDGTDTYSGTSMACPHVSGSAAVLLGIDSSLSPTDVKDQLLRASTPNKVTDPRSVNRLLYIGTETCMTRCGAGQDAGQSCQCDASCSSRSDCCSDYGYLCGENAPICKDRCDSADSNYPCKCDAECSNRGDCCPDYEFECGNGGVPPPEYSGCDESLNAEGIITSPGYPEDYPNSVRFHSCITAGSGEKVMLTFLDFDLEDEYECSYDMLRIYDGSDGSSPLLGVFCGEDFEYQDYIESTGESMYVVFQSDDSVTHTGFQAEITFFVPPPEYYGCDESLDAEGIITSPGYPGDYPDSVSFHSCITAGSGEKVILTFFDFDLEYEYECSYDMLRIHDGSDGSSPILGTFCGEHFVYPDYIESTGESLYVVFQSDDSVTHRGFESEIAFLGSDGCDETVNSEGLISSPHYSGHYLNDQLCYTLITAGAGETVVLNYEEFDIEYEWSCDWDSLSVYDGSDDSSSILGVYCGDWWDVPYYDQTSGANAFLVFESDSSVVGGGYVIDVEFSSSQVALEEKKIKPTMGIPERKPTMGIPEKKANNRQSKRAHGTPEKKAIKQGKQAHGTTKKKAIKQGKRAHGKHKAPKRTKI